MSGAAAADRQRGARRGRIARARAGERPRPEVGDRLYAVRSNAARV